ncbi:hypothetical protein DK37_13005 [Halomonas sp. SUBG004]|nr:hypothetical protein DK37_13005 [Halomonas sp. SUBG004]
MSPKTQMIASTLLFIMASVVAQADTHLAYIEQVGDNHNARMIQAGIGLKASLYQEGDSSRAQFQQLGDHHTILGLDDGPALQSGYANWMLIDQTGERNQAFVSQQGLEKRDVDYSAW